MNHQQKSFQMLPPGPGKCPICAEVDHFDEVPHNRDSLFYQTWFCQTYGRSPLSGMEIKYSGVDPAMVRTWEQAG